MSERRTAVTGATGFLGKRICAELVARGERVVALGRRFEQFPSFDPALCEQRSAALEDEGALLRALEGADTVIHAAALSTTWGRRENFVRANVDGTRRLLEAARATGVRRVVHVSSSSVVFTGEDRTNLREDAPRPARFHAHYCETKALAEDVVRASSGVEHVIVRPRGIFGPGDTTILPRLVARARRGKLRIIGHGRNVQDITYVDNVVDALLLARDAPAAAGRTYFVSNGEPVVLWEFIAKVLRGVGLAPPTRHVPFALVYSVAAAMEAAARLAPALGGADDALHGRAPRVRPDARHRRRPSRPRLRAARDDGGGPRAHARDLPRRAALSAWRRQSP
jgi:nucleoside-diphosphate-sugar epimerase